MREVRGFTAIKALVPYPGGELMCHDAEPDLCSGPRPVTRYTKWGCDIYGLSKMFDHFSPEPGGGTPAYLCVPPPRPSRLRRRPSPHTLWQTQPPP